MPENQAPWVDELRSACAASTQKAVGKRIGYSASVVNQVLKGIYPGDLVAVQRAVETELMSRTVDCPVLGDLARSACIEHQQAKARNTNPMRVQLALACPKCPHRRKP
jgi:hypothetical protein